MVVCQEHPGKLLESSNGYLKIPDPLKNDEGLLVPRDSMRPSHAQPTHFSVPPTRFVGQNL